MSDNRLLFVALSWLHYDESLLPVIIILCVMKIIIFHRTAGQTDNYNSVESLTSGFIDCNCVVLAARQPCKISTL